MSCCGIGANLYPWGWRSMMRHHGVRAGVEVKPMVLEKGVYDVQMTRAGSCVDRGSWQMVRSLWGWSDAYLVRCKLPKAMRHVRGDVLPGTPWMDEHVIWECGLCSEAVFIHGLISSGISCLPVYWLPYRGLVTSVPVTPWCKFHRFMCLDDPYGRALHPLNSIWGTKARSHALHNHA